VSRLKSFITGASWCSFQKGQDKEKLARPYLQAAARQGEERIVLIGIAQEKRWFGGPSEEFDHRHTPLPCVK